MNAGINLAAYQAAPFVAGSVQDASAMQFVYQSAPFVVANQGQGAKYTYDSLGRLTKITFTQGTTIVYNYDSAGNRTSLVTTCGPHGC